MFANQAQIREELLDMWEFVAHKGKIKNKLSGEWFFVIDDECPAFLRKYLAPHTKAAPQDSGTPR